ncbi:Uma2 family endonuclease [Chromatium okenii]|uniref:Uma2 family endonuclease n=1 Tax=Chromatium okenii TaxID=61644 RepID=UPI0024131314|nr:Uma2 family endonuclease [Chromatium okenii]
MAHAQSQSSFVTYADYQTWPDFPRYELFEGKVYAMAPAPSINHQRLALGIATQIKEALKSKSCQVYSAS